eukprot:g1233.t1
MIPRKAALDEHSVVRYGRQLVIPGIGKKGQQRLRSASILVVGAGGLGCPVIAYLAAAGIGRLGVMDDDEVDLSNLHRQILHTERASNIRTSKVESVRTFVGGLNSLVQCSLYRRRFVGNEESLRIVREYDVVVDCTDNVASRYLISDACVLANRPLVFGAAVGFDGHVSVFNGSKDCPCYRCLHPRPPPPECVGSCSKNGILGPVVGTLGSLMALETIKLITHSGRTLVGRMLIVDGWSCRFRSVKLPPRSSDCAVCRSSVREVILPLAKTCLNLLCKCETCTCGEGCTCGVSATVVCDPCVAFKKRMMGESQGEENEEEKCDEVAAPAAAAESSSSPSSPSSIRRMADASAFCEMYGLCNGGPRAQAKHTARVVTDAAKLPKYAFCSAKEYASVRHSKHFLLDVRPRAHYNICKIEGAVCVPMSELHRSVRDGSILALASKSEAIFVVCQVGVKSQRATRLLLDNGWQSARSIAGGLLSWKRDVDAAFCLL